MRHSLIHYEIRSNRVSSIPIFSWSDTGLYSNVRVKMLVKMLVMEFETLYCIIVLREIYEYEPVYVF